MDMILSEEKLTNTLFEKSLEEEDSLVWMLEILKVMMVRGK